ncbi:hypothetical protein L2E82_04723 [Cichorium intybus]|uniref:Uncharacterized protein n=1 Tax=Cichorium intybus TaxID=13427 RepID=A0ACB9H6S5_CICIN|nr:hypothetical protein L2E82_04723 [Cichorium intybus]
MLASRVGDDRYLTCMVQIGRGRCWLVDNVEDWDVDSYDEWHSRIINYEWESMVDYVFGPFIDLMSSNTPAIVASPNEEVDVFMNCNDDVDGV